MLLDIIEQEEYFMFAIKAIYDGTSFKPIHPVPVKGDYEVIITFIKPTEKDSSDMYKLAKLPRSTIKGLLRGKVRMSDDFNEPLEEMKEYME